MGGSGCVYSGIRVQPAKKTAAEANSETNVRMSLYTSEGATILVTGIFSLTPNHKM
jgi:hypothetical protein